MIGWDPCPLDAECEKCGHPMRGHFGEGNGRKGYGWACRACSCQFWCCRHGGVKPT